MALLTGIILGLSTLLFIGPVFFYLLKSSIESGVKAGIAVATGIIVGDIICVILAIYGFGKYFETVQSQKIFAGVGGILLLFFGISYVIKKTFHTDSKVKLTSKNLFPYFLNGFFINFINPFVFAVWFGFYTLNKAKLENENYVIFSLIITLCVIFLTDIIKVLFANKISQVIKPKKLKVIFKIFGIIMIGFSFRLFFIFAKL